MAELHLNPVSLMSDNPFFGSIKFPSHSKIVYSFQKVWQYLYICIMTKLCKLMQTLETAKPNGDVAKMHNLRFVYSKFYAKIPFHFLVRGTKLIDHNFPINSLIFNETKPNMS